MDRDRKARHPMFASVKDNSYDGSMGNVDGEDTLSDQTPRTPNPCPDCGREMVLIGLEKMHPPEVVTEDVWMTIFANYCVKAPWWRWCCGGGAQGHLSVWVSRP